MKHKDPTIIFGLGDGIEDPNDMQDISLGATEQGI